MSFGYSCCTFSGSTFRCLWHGVLQILLLAIYTAPNFVYMITVGGQIEPRNFYAIITLSFAWVKSLHLKCTYFLFRPGQRRIRNPPRLLNELLVFRNTFDDSRTAYRRCLSETSQPRQHHLGIEMSNLHQIAFIAPYNIATPWRQIAHTHT